METATREKMTKGRVAGLLVAIVLIAAAVWGWVEFRYDFIPKRFGVIVPGELYRSGQLSPRLIKKTMEEHRIKVIVDFQGAKEGDSAMMAEQEACKELGVEYHRFPLAGDGTGEIARYADALEVMTKSQREHKAALIHCSAGAQRTGAATVFYRLLVEKKTPGEAYEELMKYGADPRGKDAKLIQYINSHMRELAGMLVERHVIDKVSEPLPQLPE